MAPEIAAGISPSDSLQYNIVWTEQFRDLVRTGQLYPRWLPQSWAGLGSPTFYIYPPFFSWVAALVDFLSFGLLPIERLVPVTSMVVLTASGLTMNSWLKSHAGARISLLGTIVYMAAPYHLQDIYVRGALAESCAFAMIPLLMLSLRRLSQGRYLFLIAAATSYSALILAHVPTALLVSLFLVPPYILFEAWRSPLGRSAFLSAASAAIVLGLGLSAFYLVPALTLRPHISYGAFFGSFYQPQSWFFWNANAWPREAPVIFAMTICAAALPMAFQIGQNAWRTRHADALFWTAIVVFSLAMVSGTLPFLWNVPLVDKVQFPFRFLVITEFALITAIVVARPRLTNPLFVAGALVWSMAVGSVLVLILVLSNVNEVAKSKRVEWTRTEYRDGPEYLPPGTPMVYPTEPGVPESAAIVLPQVPPVSVDAAGSKAFEQRRKDGGARVTVESSLPATATLRRFYFPHWRVLDDRGKRVEASASRERLLSWPVPAGRSVYQVELGPAPGERLGQTLTGLAFLILALLSWVLLLRARKVNDKFTNPA